MDNVEWWASGGNIERCGPYADQVSAVEAMRLVGSTDERPRYPGNMRTWPERKRSYAQTEGTDGE